jgi:hypothetical protein
VDWLVFALTIRDPWSLLEMPDKGLAAGHFNGKGRKFPVGEIRDPLVRRSFMRRRMNLEQKELLLYLLSRAFLNVSSQIIYFPFSIFYLMLSNILR